MPPIVVIALFVGLPIILTLLMRTNAAIVVLALCAGAVLQQFAGADATTLFNSFSSNSSEVMASAGQIFLLFFPAGLTILFWRKSMRGGKMLFNLVPAIGGGLLAALLAVPLLAPGLRYNVEGSSPWSTLVQFQSAVVAGALLASFLILWTSHPKHPKNKKHK